MKILDVPRSGSYQGITSGHNRAGQYVRNRRAPVQPIGTGRRSTIRTAMAAASSGFSALTAAQIAAWNSFGDTHPVTDALGQSIKLTGHQWYIAVGVQLLNVGESLPTDPPSDASVYSLAGSTVAASVASGITLTAPGSGLATDWLLLGVSKQMSKGRGFWKTFWQGAIGAGDAATLTISKSDYEKQFGTLVIGNKLFVRATPVSAAGVTGVPVILGTVVVA